MNVEYNNKNESVSFEIFCNEVYFDVDIEFMGTSLTKQKKRI